MALGCKWCCNSYGIISYPIRINLSRDPIVSEVASAVKTCYSHSWILGQVVSLVYISNQPLGQKEIMKYTTVKISEIRKHPTMRLDAGYWIKKKKKAASRKLQAASLTRLKDSVG